jgi:hypothetical protein
MVMTKKQGNAGGAAGGDKKRPGKPKVLPPDLDTRHQLRCRSSDLEAWSERAAEEGFPNVSAWIRKAANAALKQPAR